MATWRPKRITATKGPKLSGGLQVGGKKAPALQKPKAVKPKKPTVRKPKAPGVVGVSPAPAPWYDASQTGARDASIASALSNPLKPVTGTAAVSLARALASSGTAPLMQDFERQAGLAQSRAAAQSDRTSRGTDTLRSLIAGQLAGQQGSAQVARDRIAGAGAQLTATVDQGAAQAEQAAAADASTRGAGLDGGSAAQRAQEAANARARGMAGTSIALDQQAAAGQANDALLNQISAATAQQGGERLGSITGALNSQLRDVNEGRAKALAAGEQQFLKSIMDLQSHNTQTKLATETLGLNQAKAAADTALEQARLDQAAKIASLNAKIKQTEGAEQRKLRKQLADATLKQRALDRAARVEVADKSRASADKRAADKLQAQRRKEKTSPAKLSDQDKQRRVAIRNIDTLLATGVPKATSPSQLRRKLETRGVKSILERQIITDLTYGGLRPNTIAGYRAQYGRNPPSTWRRFKAPPKKPAASGALGNAGRGLVDSIADALKGL